MSDLSCQILLCTENCGELITKGRRYYCFADEGYDFWLDAQFLLETHGVTQLKCSGKYRDKFKIVW